MKPTCLVAGLFNYDTFLTKETADAPERVVSQEVGGTGGVVSKLMASLGWTTIPVCRFDDSEEGMLLRDGLAAYGCDMRCVSNLPDGGTTILKIVLTKRPDGSYKQRIFRSNSKDKAKGFDSRYPRWKFVKKEDARRIVEGLDVLPDVFFFDAPAPGHRELASLLHEKGALVYFEPFPTKDGRSLKSMEVADIVKFSRQDYPDVSFVDKYPEKLFIQTLGGPEGARFRFPGRDWQTVPGFSNEKISSPLGCGDWTTVGFLTTLWRSGGVKFSELTPERVASALSEGQRYASRNCSYFTTCCDELLDELGVRNIVEKPIAGSCPIEVVGGIIRRGEKYLLGKRPEGKSQGGHWEFIGGKIEPGETPEEALARECREEIALDIVNERIRTAVTHAYPDRTIHLTLIDCEPAPGAEPTALEHSDIGWFTPAEMQSLDFCPADAELLPVIFRA